MSAGPINWYFECTACKTTLRPQDSEHPTEEERAWIQEHYPHGFEMVIDPEPS